MSKKILSRFIVFMSVLIVLGFSFSFLLQRRWKRSLMQNETKKSTEEAPQEELLPVEDEDMDFGEEDSYDYFNNEFSRLEKIEEDENWQRDLPLRRRAEKIADLYDAEMQRLVSYYGKIVKGSDRENFFAEQSIFLSERSRESKKELSRKKTGVEENIDYLKKYIALTKSRCSSILERISGESDEKGPS